MVLWMYLLCPLSKKTLVKRTQTFQQPLRNKQTNNPFDVHQLSSNKTSISAILISA